MSWFAASAASVSQQASISAVDYGIKRAIRHAKCDSAFRPCKDVKPEKGDILEYNCGTYEHFAIYIGDGDVIEFCNNKDGTGVIVEGKMIKEFECRVNMLKTEADKRGLKLKPVKDIMKTAYSKVDSKENYDINTNNCEHFVTFCAYGEKFSVQSEHVKGNVLVQIAAMAGDFSS